MSDTTPEPMLSKVRKLLAKAEATDNANEAEAFSAKAAALIAAHRIDPAHLAAGAAGAGGSDALVIEDVLIGRGADVRARLALLAAVASANDCELVWRSGPAGAVAVLAGFSADVETTVVLYESLHLQAAAQMAAVRRSTPAATQRWRRAFLFGFASHMADLLAQSRRDAERAAQATGSRLPDLPARSRPGHGVRHRVVRPGGRGPGAEPRRRRRVGPRSSGGGPGRSRAAPGRGSPRHRPRRPVRAEDGGPTADHGREAVYAAEEAAFGGTDLDRTVALDDLVLMAAGVVAGDWWASCGAPPVEVVGGRADASSSSARAGVGTGVLIRLAPTQRTAATVAHELGHALAGVGHGHDGRFRAAHVDVVAMLAGGALATILARAYAAHDVPPGDRSWPPPERARGPGFVIVP